MNHNLEEFEEDFDYLLDEQQPTKGINMMDNMGKKMIDRMFRKIEDAVWDLMSGKIGIRTPDGIATLEGEGDDAQISLNVMDDFGMPLPAYAQSTPVDSIKNGDLIYNNGRVLGYVIKKTEKGFRVIKLDGTITSWNPPKVNMIGMDLGASGPLVLRSLINTLPGGETGLDGLKGNLLPLMMMSGGNMDMDKMMPMILLSQSGAFGGAAAGGNMFQTMMMMQMMSGGNSENPMSSMFGGKKSGSSHFSRTGA